MADTDSSMTKRRGVKRLDWPSIIDRLKKQPGQEVKIGDGILTASATYAKKRYGIRTRMENQDQVTARGTLYAWWPNEEEA